MRKSSEGTTLPTGNIWVRKLSPKACFASGSPYVAKLNVIRRRRGRIVGELRLYGVEHHRALGQADRGAGTTVADRRFQVALSLVDRLADAGAVDAKTRKAVIQPADAGKQPFQGVTLDLPAG